MDYRQKIHDKLLENRFRKKGGITFHSLNGFDIGYAFGLYDKFVFGMQIRDKIASTKSSIHFFARGRKSGVGSFCGITSTTGSQSCEYHIDIAPNILARLQLKIDRITRLQLILEKQIIHLLMIMWGFLHKVATGPKAYIYSENGPLYQCVFERYFGVVEHNVGVTSIDLERPITYRSPISGKFGMMINRENSCYLDSLITVLFLGESPFYRKNIFDVNPSKISYPRPICRGDSRIDNERKTRVFASKIQERLREDYSRIVYHKEVFHCSGLRKLLRRCFPDMKAGGIWEVYNASAVYSTITDIFPNLKIKKVPTIIHLPNKKPFREIKQQTMFQFWDYLGSNKSEGEEILWSKLKAPVLVFQNGGLPPVIDFGSTGPESVGKRVFTKVRAFGKTIIDDTYGLFGVVMLHGTQPGRDGGSHYTAYVKTKGGQWYYYNDVGPVFKPKAIGNVFREARGSKPEMYFYRRLPKKKLQVKLINRPGHKTIVIVGTKDSEIASEIQKLNPRKAKIPNTWYWIVPPNRALSLKTELLSKLKKRTLT